MASVANFFWWIPDEKDYQLYYPLAELTSPDDWTLSNQEWNKSNEGECWKLKQEYEPTTTEEKQDRRNEMKARATLLMAQQYENFAALSSETMDKTFNSTNNTNNTNKADNTAHGVSTTHTQGNGVNSTSLDNLCDAMICAFLASQPISFNLSRRSGTTSSLETPTQKLDSSDGIGGYDWKLPSLRRATYKPCIDGIYILLKFFLIWGFIQFPTSYRKFHSRIMTVENKGVSNIVESYDVRYDELYTSAPIIEDWNSDDEINIAGSKPTVNHPRPISNAYKKVKDTTARDRAIVSKNKGKGVNAVKASACWVWKAKNSRQPTTKGVQGKGVIDSGCSRHMTKNKCYLTEYEDYDGGFVSFRDGK
ncbi:hypothetical protein Tco_0510982, partial [Tanacetum coccineum]